MIDLSEDECMDINAINVNIPDQYTPIVVLFGAPHMGKTMALIRMIRWFESHGMTVKPELSFRPSYDEHYRRMCDSFNATVWRDTCPPCAGLMDFMLVKILDRHGRSVCQLIDVPGEHFFGYSKCQLHIPAYMQHILNAPNRKVSFVFFCEKDWEETQQTRNAYVEAIRRMQFQMTPIGKRGKAVFLFSKVDRHYQYYDKYGSPVFKRFFRSIYNQYPGIFDNYTNHGIKKLLFGSYACKALCFSAGVFTRREDGSIAWTQGNDLYCEQFWKAIK